MPKITKTLIDSLSPPPKSRELWVGDTQIPGFGVRLLSNGSGTYMLRYRTAEGRARRYLIGRVGVLTPDQARAEALERKRAVTLGGDPAGERKSKRAALTIAELGELSLADSLSRPEPIKASTWAMDRSRLDVHIKPLIGSIPIGALTAADIERMQLDIVAGKTAREPKVDPDGKRIGRGGIARGGRGVAGKCVVQVKTMLEFARRKKLIAENPARDIKQAKGRKKDRYLSLEEIGRLGEAMRAAEAAEGGPGLAALRFLALTGFRRHEALALRREWVDRHARVVRFPDTKTGAQIRVIGSAALALIKAQPIIKDNPFVFPGAVTGSHFTAARDVLARLCVVAELADVTPHTLRHSFASVAAALGYSEIVIGGLLGHRLAGITMRYSHLADSALTAAADRVAARIEAALDGRAWGEVSSMVGRRRKRA